MGRLFAAAERLHLDPWVMASTWTRRQLDLYLTWAGLTSGQAGAGQAQAKQPKPTTREEAAALSKQRWGGLLATKEPSTKPVGRPKALPRRNQSQGDP